ncbi:Raffinose synthase [Penicillium expansum]|nr:Raffinose synthase [Penicillium expansum]
MQANNRDISTLPIQGPGQSARQSQAPFVQPAQMAMFARVTSYPPLGQLTCLQPALEILRSEEDAVSLPNMMISNIATAFYGHDRVQQLIPAQSWEAQIWHNITSPEWGSLPLKRCDTGFTALLTGNDSDYHYHRYVFSEEISLPAAGGHAQFTVRFRTGPDTEWQWANQTHPVSDGEIIYSARHSDFDKAVSTDVAGRAPKKQLEKYIDNLQDDLQIESRLSEAPGSVLWALSGDIDGARNGSSTIKRLALGTPSSVVRYFSLVRVSSAWLGPRHGKNNFRITEDAMLCSFLREDGVNLVLLAVSGVNDVLTMFQSGAKGEVVISAKSDDSEASKFHVLVSAAENFEVAMSAVIYEARKVVRPFADGSHLDLEDSVPLSPPGDDMVLVEKDPSAQWLSEWFDGLAYCTWNGLGQDLTEEKILHALDSLKANGINIVNLIIDDGWQANDNEGESQFKQGWKHFEAHSKGFPKGLKHTVGAIHRAHPNIEHIAVWHALLGYWEAFHQMGIWPKDGTILAIDPDDIKRFYDEFYSYLTSVGIDSVKTDAQFFLDLLEDPADRRKFMTSYQDAWSIASLQHFSTRSISCGSMIPQIIFHSQIPTNKPTLPLRNSDDFFPNVVASHPWHVFCNAHNALLTRYLNVLPDWDMFQTSHPYASFHAAARCVSGGPIYITDEPGKHDLTLLDQMTAPTVKGTTVILRPSVIGRTIDMYHDYSEGHVLRVGSYTGWAKTGSGILGLFNIQSAEASSIVSLMDFSGIHEDSEGQYIVRAHSSGKISHRMSPTRDSLVSVVLEPKGWEILTAYPTRSFTLKGSHGDNVSRTHVAVLGLLGKMTGAAAVVTSDISVVENGRLRVDISLKALGTLGIYFSDLQNKTIAKNFMVTILGLPIPQKTVWKQGGENAHVLAIDVLAAWKSMNPLRPISLIFTFLNRSNAATVGIARPSAIPQPSRPRRIPCGARSFAATTAIPLRGDSNRPVLSASQSGTCFQQQRWITQKYIQRMKDGEKEWAGFAKEIKAGNRKNFAQHLEERGLIHDVVGERDLLHKVLTEKRAGIYVGIDPTAPSMHVGHMLPFMVLAWGYVWGLPVTFLLGGATSRVGDPSGRLKGRDAVHSSIRKANMASMHMQLKKLGSSIEQYGRRHGHEKNPMWKRALTNNNTWWNSMPFLEVLRDLGAFMRLGPMLGRDTVKTRLNQGDGMSFAEFSYPILQAWDWWTLFQKGTQIQVGGADQYGNILFGMEAVKSISRNTADEQIRNPLESELDRPIGFTTPLLTTASGEKLGKSAGNAVWLDKDLTSTFELYQYFVRTPDDVVEQYLKLFTFIPLPEIATIMEEQNKDPSKRVAQHKLALEFVELVHGKAEADAVALQHRQLFRPRSSTAEPTPLLKSSPPQAGHPQSPTAGFQTPQSGNPYAPQTNWANMGDIKVTLPESLVFNQPFNKILWSAGLVSSKSEGHRVIVNNGAKVGSRPGDSGPMSDQLSFTPIRPWDAEKTKEFVLNGNLLMLKLGKWKLKAVHIVTDEEYRAQGLTAPGWETEEIEPTEPTEPTKSD